MIRIANDVTSGEFVDGTAISGDFTKDLCNDSFTLLWAGGKGFSTLGTAVIEYVDECELDSSRMADEGGMIYDA